MSPEASQEYQHAVEEAANAFMKVMTLRGFQVRDYPQNFVAQMSQNTRRTCSASPMLPCMPHRPKCPTKRRLSHR